MNLCTLVGHDYRSQGYTSYIPGYPDEHDVDHWCERCEDLDAPTIVTLWFDVVYWCRMEYYRFRKYFSPEQAQEAVPHLTIQAMDFPDSAEPQAAPVSTCADHYNAVRRDVKATAARVKDLCDDAKASETAQGEDKGEKIANLMLCYRHLEDASMRLGKAIQAYDGGVSVYDRTTTVGA